MNTASEVPTLHSVTRRRAKPQGLVRFSAALLGLCLLLTGCGKEEVFQVTDEATANAMVSVLISKGIPAEKKVVSDGVWSIRVDEAEFPTAIDILDWYGLPEKKFPGIDDFYKKSGLVSTPGEEQARYMHTISQQLAETIVLINGVIDARVQVVLPENNPVSNTQEPASASVFIKYRRMSSVENMIPEIKEMVANSVEGLTYQKVSVSTFPSVEWASLEVSDFQNRVSFMGIEVYADSLTALKTLFFVQFCIIFLFALLCVYLIWRLQQKSSSPETPEPASTDEEEAVPSETASS